MRQIQAPDGALLSNKLVEGEPFVQTNELIRHRYHHWRDDAVSAGYNQTTNATARPTVGASNNVLCGNENSPLRQ